MEVMVNKINVATREMAIEHKLLTSPTIRVNGKDIDPDFKETLCECCGDLCGDNVDCRVWVYQGKEYTVPPKALIINAILSEIYGSNAQQPEAEYTLPENLKAYFDALEKNTSKK